MIKPAHKAGFFVRDLPELTILSLTAVWLKVEVKLNENQVPHFCGSLAHSYLWKVNAL